MHPTNHDAGEPMAIDFTPARAFLREHTGRRIAIAPFPDTDGLAGAAILWRALEATKVVVCPPKGLSIYTHEFHNRVLAEHPDALILVDQGSNEGALAPGIPTLTIDHHQPDGVPLGVFLSSADRRPSESTADLCYRLVGEPDALLWLAAIGIAGDYGMQAPFAELRRAQPRYTRAALQEVVTLVNSARRSSRYDWANALRVLIKANDPREIADGAFPETATLRAEHEEVRQETDRARKARPIVSAPWAVVPFNSPCLVHGMVATSWMGRLHDLFIVAANFGYRSGYVYYSIRSKRKEQPAEMLRQLARHRETLAAEMHAEHDPLTGAITQDAFILLLSGMGFRGEYIREILRRGTLPPPPSRRAASEGEPTG